MKSKILFAVRCNPTVTQNKVAKINSKATCFITELLKPKEEQDFLLRINLIPRWRLSVAGGLT